MAANLFDTTQIKIENNLRQITDAAPSKSGIAKARLWYDPSTDERGLQVKLINRTGSASVKGTLVSCSTTTDKEVIKQANEYDTVGVVYEAGVAEGNEMWVWMLGSVAQVLYKDNTASTRGNILIADGVDGRGSDISNPGSGLPATDTHFKECGHVMQTKSAPGAGVANLVLCILHFN